MIKVTIIVPVFNAQSTLAKLLNSIVELNYPKEQLQVLFVDNMSSDKSPDIVRNFGDVELLFETKLQGSYAARNKAIEAAQGEIIAFTDSDCIVSPGWLNEGLEEMMANNIDIVAGNVEFFYEKKSAAEIYDSLVNMQNEINVRERKIGKTANLFVRKHLFNEIGLFDANLRSGGDVEWTKKATDAGFTISYASKAIVYHPARNYKELIIKQVRVGRGQMKLWFKDGKRKKWIANRIFSGFMPVHFKALKVSMLNKDIQPTRFKIISIWLIAWIAKLSTNYGRLTYCIGK
ncbi:MAG: glycosyltransferase [Bacteroidales bacterium]